MTASSVAPFAMIASLLGGLALFFFGMEQLSGALEAVAGERMKLRRGSRARSSPP